VGAQPQLSWQFASGSCAHAGFTTGCAQRAYQLTVTTLDGHHVYQSPVVPSERSRDPALPVRLPPATAFLWYVQAWMSNSSSSSSSSMVALPLSPAAVMATAPDAAAWLASSAALWHPDPHVT
jgi:hypothetical protein